MLPNEDQAFLPRERGTESQSAQLRKKRVTVFNAQCPLDGPVPVFDCDGLGHMGIQNEAFPGLVASL